MVKRYAFTMIELIFAIVIIGISVLSLPMMTQITSKGIESNIVQEAIFAASTELNQAVSYYWDENSIQTGHSLARVIDLGDCDNTSRLRLGHIVQPYHRKCLDSNTTTPTNLLDAGNPDLNDAAHGAQSIFLGDSTSSEGYKNDYDSSIIVTKDADFNGTKTNMKQISVIITNKDGDIITSLRTYSANIGEIDYFKMRY